MSFLSGALGKTIEYISMSGCNDELVSLKCPVDHKIAIKRIYYGVNADRRCASEGRNYKEDCCLRTYSDCIVQSERDYARVNSFCSGFVECNYNMTSISAFNQCKGISASKTDYMTIIYDCVPGNYKSLVDFSA